MHFLCTKAVEQIAHYESRFILIADMEVKMDKLYWGAVVIFAIAGILSNVCMWMATHGANAIRISQLII